VVVWPQRRVVENVSTCKKSWARREQGHLWIFGPRRDLVQNPKAPGGRSKCAELQMTRPSFMPSIANAGIYMPRQGEDVARRNLSQIGDRRLHLTTIWRSQVLADPMRRTKLHQRPVDALLGVTNRNQRSDQAWRAELSWLTGFSMAAHCWQTDIFEAGSRRRNADPSQPAAPMTKRSWQFDKLGCAEF